MPSLHYKGANPRDRLREQPVLCEHEAEGVEEARGAEASGVSSFGIGGTNAHVIVGAGAGAEAGGDGEEEMAGVGGVGQERGGVEGGE